MDLAAIPRHRKSVQYTDDCPRHFILVEWSGETTRTHDELMDWFQTYLVRHYPPIQKIDDDRVQRVTRYGFVIRGFSENGITHVVRCAMQAWKDDGHTERPVVVPLVFNGFYTY